MVSIQNVTFGYEKDRNVLENFSLEFGQGGIYGLLGKNGTGKSTLLYLISGLLRPQGGEVRVGGCISQDRQPGMMQDLFIVPEEYDLPAIPLQQYVAALKPFYPRFSDALLERCLEGFEMPKDLNLGALSMGQKKKVYMCIALATNTRYLLMDEPTNGLDILSKSQFRKVVISGMSDEKTIIISTHQVHDVERMLDHVCIIDRNRVLFSAPLNEDNGPVDLERLFIEVERGEAPLNPPFRGNTSASISPLKGEPEGAVSPLKGEPEGAVTRGARSRWQEFLDVARWDLTVNCKFYVRQITIMASLVLVPIIFKYVMLLGKFHLFNAAAAGAMMAAEQDVVGVSYYYGLIFSVYLTMMLCYMFHNLATKQGRINELTLPATNGIRFLWHTLCSTAGTLAVFFLSVVLADLVHVLMGWAILGQTAFESITLATWRTMSILRGVDINATFTLQIFGQLLSAAFISTFALGSAYKYRYTFCTVMLGHLCLWLCLCLTFLLGMTGHLLLSWVDYIVASSTLSASVFSVFCILIAAGILAFIWRQTYRLYCRAQVTTRRNR